MSANTKQPWESRLYDFSFASDMADAENIESVVSVVGSPDGLTIGTPAFSGKVVQVRIEDGTEDVYYKVTCRVITTLGNKLELDGTLWVKEM